MLKTSKNADHVGHLPQQELWSLIGLFPPGPFPRLTLLSSSWLIVPIILIIVDAKEGFHLTHLSTLSKFRCIEILMIIRYNGGINPERVYPYLAKDSGSCRYDTTMNAAYVPGGSRNITAGDEDELLRAVAFEGPVAIGYQAAEGFRDYTGGVYNGTGICNSTADSVNHAVVVVGFNHEDINGTSVNYWIIKNSWGEDWGERGYFNMVRGVNMCGIAECASYPSMWG